MPSGNDQRPPHGHTPWGVDQDRDGPQHRSTGTPTAKAHQSHTTGVKAVQGEGGGYGSGLAVRLVPKDPCQRVHAGTRMLLSHGESPIRLAPPLAWGLHFSGLFAPPGSSYAQSCGLDSQLARRIRSAAEVDEGFGRADDG